jgi:hypothetical protein
MMGATMGIEGKDLLGPNGPGPGWEAHLAHNSVGWRHIFDQVSPSGVSFPDFTPDHQAFLHRVRGMPAAGDLRLGRWPAIAVAAASQIYAGRNCAGIDAHLDKTETQPPGWPAERPVGP